jgi:hypothetical protein
VANRTWIGGGNNRADNPNDWSPSGVPLPGDILILNGPGVPINIQGNDLAGDTLFMGGITNETVNLSHNAVVSAVQENNLVPPTTINVSGSDTLKLSSGEATHPSGGTINLDPHAKLTIALNLIRENWTIKGGADTNVINDQSSVLNGANVTIAPDVLGKGSFTVASGAVPGGTLPGHLEFIHRASKGQTITLGDSQAGGVLKLDRPDEFHGSVVIQDNSLIDLLQLAGADSYAYKDDILKLYEHNKVIDKLHVTNDSSTASSKLVVAKSSTDVFISDKPVSGATVLPLHT